MFSYKEQPQDILGVIADGFRLFRYSIGKVWYWQIVFLIVMGLVLSLTTLLLGGEGETKPYLPTAILSYVFLFLLSLFAYCFIAVRINAVGDHGDTSIKHAARLSLRKIIPLIISGIIVAAVISLFGSGMYFLSLALENPWIAGALSFLMVILSVLLYVLTILFPFFMLFENKGILGCLGASINHVWGSFWKTLGLLIGFNTLSLLIIFAFAVPLNILMQTAGSQAVLLMSMVGLSLCYLSIYVFLFPLVIAVLLVLYHDLKHHNM